MQPASQQEGAMTLSSAALAVWEAFNSEEPGVFVDYGDCLAAALRTLAEKSGRAFLTIDGEPAQGADYISVADVLAIADELEQAYFGELND
jgi:hypothetical protein